MTVKLFETWDWDLDCGVGPLPDDKPLPRFYALAYYDWRGHLYRVWTCARILANVEAEGEVSVYDYFCDSYGRVVEKRALDNQFNVDVIVSINYDESNGTATEVGWSREGGVGKSITRRR